MTFEAASYGEQLAVGGGQLAVGSGQLAVGSWQLAVGSWQLAVGSWQFTAFEFEKLSKWLGLTANRQLQTANCILPTANTAHFRWENF